MSEKIKDLVFKRADNSTEDNILDFVYLDNGDRITVVDRITGFGWRDTESAYTEKSGEFHQAVGNFDVRLKCADMTPEEAKQAIREYGV